MRTGDRVILRGQRWTVLETAAYADCETVRLAEATGPLVRTFVLPFDRARPERADRSSVRVVRPRHALHRLRRTAVRVRPFGGLHTAARASIALLPYQLAPALAMLRHGWARLLIADDAGLGKTIQAGLIAAEICARRAASRVLVLVPAGLRRQWAAEMAAHFQVAVASADSAWLKAVTAELPPGANPWTLPGVYLASHDFVKRPEVLRPLEDVRWDLLVVDEAHGATIATDRREAIDAVARRSRRVVLLTATPHDADPPQQSSLTGIGATPADEPWIAFRRTRSIVAPGPGRQSRVLLVRPGKDERRMHRLLEDYTGRVWREATARGDPDAKLASILLRKRALSSAGSLALSVGRRMDLLAGRTVDDVAQMALPLGEDESVEDAVPSAALAAPGLEDARLELRWLAAILEAARRASSHESKLYRIGRFLGRLKEPAIVFTEYRDTLARVRGALVARGFSVAILHGGMSCAERAAAQEALGTGAQVMLATDAAAEGLNLQARCRLVIHYELPWNPARLQQRAGRVDRIGQRRRVHEIALVADDTAERLVLEPFARRAAAARRGHDSAMFRAVTESRIAAAVLGNQPFPDSAAGAAADEVAEHDWTRRVPDLSSEARAEAALLQIHRNWIARSAGDGCGIDDERPTVSMLSAKSRHGRAVFVYEVSLHASDGSLQHSELAVMDVGHAAARIGRSAAAVRSLVERIRGKVERRVSCEIGDRLRQTAVAAAAAFESARAREQAIAATTASSARRLVQRGLFDRAPHSDPTPPFVNFPTPALDLPIPSLLHPSIDLVAVWVWR